MSMYASVCVLDRAVHVGTENKLKLRIDVIEYADGPCAFAYIVAAYIVGVEILTKLIGQLGLCSQ